MLDCRSFVFSRHAIVQMFARGIDPEEVKAVCLTGSIIESYEGDNPFPSYLLSGRLKDKVLHVVVARDATLKQCIVVTTYIPDLKIWNKDFKTRKKS